MTKILSLVAIMVGFIAFLGFNAYSSIYDLHMGVVGLSERSDRLRITNDMIDAQNLVKYSEAVIAIKDTAESVKETEKNLANYKKVFTESMPIMLAAADAEEAPILQELQKRYDVYVAQIEVTLREANEIYIQKTKEDDSALKASIAKSEASAQATLEKLWELCADMGNDVAISKDAAIKTATDAERSIIIVSAIIAVFGFGFGYVLSSAGISKPLVGSVDVLKKLANNDLDVDVKGADRKDEIGDVARAANFFKESLTKQREMVEAEKREQVLKEQRQKRVQELIESFDINATQTVSTVASASTQLSQTAEGMSKIADETNRQSVEVASASEQASHNVQSVASAAEEMAATVQEISRQIAISNNMVQDAMTKAEAADASSRELVDMSSAVGAIATLIEDIAGQINLLALNATIESARSGEAGKGFAVVANEVKNLATQTAKATEQIRQQLDGVQKTAVNVADVLLSVREAIGKVDETSATIAAAVEEQAAATQEIVSNMNTATQGVEQINGGIFSIKGGTDSTTAATREVLDAARMLSVQAEKMDGEVKSFLRDIQAA
ncbi:methyl-accepting chemotaxis protein [Micavibrio aeruginosavorus]|uniref:methyl-accepting chemotaxis protein n=1 Tax=Micavibrio aeruginosavorus TaxID=349221 RepID=UPI003F4AE130